MCKILGLQCLHFSCLIISTYFQQSLGVEYAIICEAVFMQCTDWCGPFVSKHLATQNTRAVRLARTPLLALHGQSPKHFVFSKSDYSSHIPTAFDFLSLHSLLPENLETLHAASTWSASHHEVSCDIPVSVGTRKF